MPYLTAAGMNSMAPLAFRPARNAPATSAVDSFLSDELAHQPANTAHSPPSNEPNPTETALIRVPSSPSQGSSNDVDMHDIVEERAQRLRAKNRRKRYLELHPEYFNDSSLELADPLLYDRTIRRFQTAAEREAEGKRKGFSGVMATDLWRAEAKKDALSQPHPHSLFTYERGPHGEILEEDKDDKPMNKEEGKAWWVDEMTQRFLRGDDDDFDYKIVDDNDRYIPPEEERDLQEAWFESMDSDFDSDGEGKEKVLTGETGIQDY